MLRGAFSKSDNLTNIFIKIIVKRPKNSKMEFPDIDSGDFTFMQRIELGQALSSTKDDIGKTLDCLHILLPAIDWRRINDILKWWNEAAAPALGKWFEKERLNLSMESTKEEKEAGIADLYKKCGDMAVVMALAKDYGKDPDEVAGWKYSKVFNILFVDKERALFERKLQKVYNNKLKAKRPQRGIKTPVRGH